MLGVDGYNPSAVQMERGVEGLPDGMPASATAAGASARAAAAAPTGPPKTGAIVPGAAIATCQNHRWSHQPSAGIAPAVMAATR